jgi:hypothetical protein
MGPNPPSPPTTHPHPTPNFSHQILTVIVDGYSHVSGNRSHGCLHLIDLAGSERVSKSEASGAQLLGHRRAARRRAHTSLHPFRRSLWHWHQHWH